jgi:hypothetical protein
VGMVPGSGSAGPTRRARSIPDQVDFPESPATAARATPGTANACCESPVTPGLSRAQSMRQRAVIVENEAIEPQRVAGAGAEECAVYTSGALEASRCAYLNVGEANLSQE